MKSKEFISCPESPGNVRRQEGNSCSCREAHKSTQPSHTHSCGHFHAHNHILNSHTTYICTATCSHTLTHVNTQPYMCLNSHVHTNTPYTYSHSHSTCGSRAGLFRKKQGSLSSSPREKGSQARFSALQSSLQP
jgi:hypothetical protein